MVSSSNYTGVWGPVTATLDWCEVGQSFITRSSRMLTPSKANYQFSPFVAEMANAFSNLVTISLGLYGGYATIQQKLPARYPLGFFVCIVLAHLGVDRRLIHLSNPGSAHRASLSSE